jgi:ATP-dependent Clp protease ATP-binding subunit ClpA
MADEAHLAELIADVRERADNQDALTLLDAAITVSQTWEATTDAMVDHFVANARTAGHSWTVIGTRLGVSKQAARQRFTDRVDRAATPSLGQVPHSPRLAAALAAATDAARIDGRPEVRTEHLLAGLMNDGIGAAALEKLGVSVEKIREAGHRLFGSPAPAGTRAPPYSADARAAVQAAGKFALERAAGPPAVAGTEHLLIVLAMDYGSRARRVLNELGVDVADIEREVACFLESPGRHSARRRRRRGRADHTAACSFCGKPRSDQRRLIAGPGIWICQECVALCVDILDQPDVP